MLSDWETVAGLVVGGFALFVWQARRVRRRFAERFPPISDDEFVVRCSPGVDPAVALRVRRLVADFLAVEYDRAHPSARFVEDLGAD